MARICRADEVRCPRHRRVFEQSAGDQPPSPGSVRSGRETGHIPNDDIAAGKGEPARLRKAAQGAGRARRAGDPPKSGLDRSSEIPRTDRRGARNEELWSNADDEELATVYEYPTHLPSS